MPKVASDYALLKGGTDFKWTPTVLENGKEHGMGVLIGSCSSGTRILLLADDRLVNM